MDRAEIIAIIEEATHQRGWISNSYAQVEFLLGDLILRCRQFPQYAQQTATFTHGAPKRVAKVRAMLDVQGPLTAYATQVSDLLDAFESHHDVRNLLAHGFCTFHFTPTGDAGLTFQKFERGDVQNGDEPDILVTRTFRLVDIHYHCEQFVALARAAVAIFADIHSGLGWSDLDPGSVSEE